MKNLMTHVCISAIVYSGCATIAAACGCSSSTGFSITMDPNETTVTAQATYYADPNCDADIQAVITAPNGTTASAFDATGGGFVGQYLTATAQYTIGAQDGTYSGVGHYNWYDNSTLTSGSWPDRTGQVQASPFVQIISTALSPANPPNPTVLRYQEGSATFTVSAITSVNCTGTVTMSANITHPNMMGIQIYNPATPDGDGAPSGDTASGTHPYLRGESHDFTFPIRTSMSNQVLGDGNATAYFSSYPCTPIPPPSGHSTSQAFRVTM
jgi:hypothetical protein